MNTKKRLDKIEETIASLMYQMCGVEDNPTKDLQVFSEFWPGFHMPKISNRTSIIKICEYLGIEIVEDPPREEKRKILVREIKNRGKNDA